MHFRTWTRAVARSALPSRTDVASRACQVRKVPQANSCTAAKTGQSLRRRQSMPLAVPRCACTETHSWNIWSKRNPSRQVRMFRDVFLIAELLDSKAESDDVGFEAELARMSCQIERAFRFVEVLKKAAADPSNRSSIDPPLFRLSRSGSNSCCQSSLSIVS